MARTWRVPYRDLLGDRIPRPYLVVDYLMNGEWTRWPALVDSGADHSVLPLGFAVLAEVPFDRSHRVTVEGIGGSAEAFRATADVELATEIGTIRLTRPGLIRDLPLLLLGRSDFGAFRVCFNERARLMELTRHRRRGSPPR